MRLPPSLLLTSRPMVSVFSWFYRNPWAIILLACLVAAVVFKDGIVKIVALRHPVVKESTATATVKHADKVFTKTTAYPDGRKVTETITDKTVTDSHAETHRDEKPQTVSNGGLWAEASYGVLDGRIHAALTATYGPFEAGVENPWAIEFSPRVKAGVCVWKW